MKTFLIATLAILFWTVAGHFASKLPYIAPCTAGCM